MVRLLLSCALAVVALVATAGAAAAHTHLVTSDPKRDAVLTEAPRAVKLRFNKPATIEADSIVVLDSAGGRVDEGGLAAGTKSETVTVKLRSGLANGAYVVRWHAVSDDAHALEGTYAFTVDVAAEADAAPRAAAPASSKDDVRKLMSQPSRQPWIALAAVARWAMFAAVLAAMGGVVFLCFVHDGDPVDRALLCKAVGVAGVGGLAASLVELVLHVAVSPGSVGAALTDSVAQGVGLRVLGLAALLGGASALRNSRISVLGLAGAGAVVVSFLLSGHAASATPRWLVIVANTTHTVAASAWFGGLVLLFVSLHERRRVADGAATSASMVASFSTVASGTVIAAAVAGVALAAVQLGNPLQLVLSAYGGLLVVKLVFVGLVVSMGRYNHRVLVPAVVRHRDAGAWRRLRRTVRAEALGLLLALGATAVIVDMAQPS